MRYVPMGPLAVLIDDVAEPAHLGEHLRRREMPGVVDVVPAARTVLVTVDDPEALAAVRDAAEAASGAPDDGTTVSVEIPVVYDGEDLTDVAAAVGLTVDEVVELHTGAHFEVAFCGFAPGFAYLSGLPPALELPRRATPRTRVPAGSVAIAAGYSAVYPTVSPGGWHLLGRTTITLFDVDRDPPALLPPGTHVRFVAA